MPQTSVTPRVDAFAYYLPQFYPVELNSSSWGDGYTEWHAVVKSQRGDRSPSGTTLTPGELGFYDLRSIETRRRQSELAHISGIAAFCIYHYYSAGMRVIPEVVDAILNDGEPDFPFFFCWANHDWTLAWQGHPEVITLKQEYNEDNVDDHFSWLLEAFKDKRYFKIGNSPVIAIYGPEAIPSSLEVLNRWRKLARQADYSGLVVLGVAHVISPRSGSDVGVDFVDPSDRRNPRYGVDLATHIARTPDSRPNMALSSLSRLSPRQSSPVRTAETIAKRIEHTVDSVGDFLMEQRRKEVP